jgi:hypothetical protein
MRLVRWAPSERVDIPDITAVSFLTLGEFRRTLRTLLSGEESYIVRGFAVEPESPATTRVRVRLQPPGQARGAAIGGEQTIAGLDHGQLIGDRDSSFLNEGPTQQILDFAGQPNGSYTVEMRFRYTDGVSDNRAFWDNGTASEYVAITDTRHVSGWQIQFVSGAPSGGEWIPLATVTWAGGTVTAGNITDLRRFLFEGSAPYSRATQSSAGGVEDFDRSASRSASNVGRFGLRSAIRALMRQIQDLKGPNDSGVFDWFSRIYKPFDPMGSLPSEQTKTLRSIDVVTYTVGDGVTTFGDFNGTSGLEAALDHIAAMTTKPERIEIVVHGGLSGNGYTITSMKNVQSGLQPCTITIRSGQTLTTANNGVFGRPRITINGAGLNANEYGLSVAGSGGGNLVLRGLDVAWTGTTANGRGMFAATGFIEAHDCDLRMSTAPASPALDAGYVLSTGFARRSVVRNCVIRGRLQFYDVGDLGGIAAPRYTGGVLENCRVEAAHVRLTQDGTPTTRNVAVGFTIRDCTFVGREGSPYNLSVSLIDGRSSQYITIEGCQFSYGINENAIDARTHLSGEAFGWRVRDCQFFSGVNNGTHPVNGGQGGTSGTGWAINIESTTTGTQSHVIENCRWGSQSVDAGGVRLHNISGAFVRDCENVFSAHGGGSETFTAIQVSATSGGWGAHVRISDCLIHKWVGGSRTRGVRLVNVNDVTIDGCTMRGDEFDGTNISGRSTTDAAVWINNCDDVRITRNHFARWNYAQTTSACIYVPSGSVCERMMIESNSFEGNGNYAIHFLGSAPNQGPIINGNQMRGGPSNNNLGMTLVNAGLRWVVSNNSFLHNSGAGFDFIFFSNMGGGVCSGNRSNADIRKTGATAIRGYKPDDDLDGLSQNLNFVNAYT